MPEIATFSVSMERAADARRRFLGTNVQLAKRAGVSVRTVWSFLNGRSLGAGSVNRLAHALGVQPADLIRSESGGAVARAS